MHFNPKRLLFAAALMAGMSVFVPDASAVPAKPGLVERHPEDGSTILVRLCGDEFSHYLLSEDGYPLVEEGGLLYFAEQAADGMMKASPFRAAAPAARDNATAGFLAAMDREAVVQRIRAKATQTGARKRSMQKGPGLCTTTFPGKGDQKALVVLVSYSDLDFKIDDPHSYFSNMLNEPGFSEWGGTGSARDYFLESSGGQFRPEFDVYGPVKLPKRMSYYGANDVWGNDQNAHMMVIHACEALDDYVDFSQYDRDGDGLIDNVFVFYAGLGEASGGAANTVWPHSFDVRHADNYPYVFDGVRLGHYACTNEWVDNRPDGCGTFIHEFSHVMGLPDLYATTYTSSFTPGEWNVLDYGPYNNNGRTPPLYSAFERYAMDWMTPDPITGPENDALPSIGSNKARIIHTTKDNENFLIENRQQVSWDKYLPGHGMLVWHVNYNKSVWDQNTVNNDPARQYVDLEEADGILTESTRSGDAFPGKSNVTSFTDDTKPSMKTWSGQNLNLPLTEIAEKNGIITFKAAGGLEVSDATEAFAPAESEVSHSGFTARWKAVEGVDHYELNVYRDANPAKSVALLKAPSAAWADAGTATEYKVEGLDPETDYAYTVFVSQTGKGLSAASNEIKVRTADAPFSSLKPKALEATEITDSTFVANWQALDGANDYLLSVSSLQAVAFATETVDFTGGKVPGAWFSSSTLTYSLPEFCGEAVPSLRLNKDDAYLRSPEFAKGISSISFWQRGVEEAEGNRLRVDWFIGDEWTEGPEFDVVIAEGGRTEELTDVPAGASAFRILYVRDKEKPYSVAIDDVKVSSVAEYETTPLPLFTDRISNGGLSLRVNGLKPNTRYCYTVVATDGTDRTLPSATVTVATADACSGIGDIIAEGLEITGCWTLDGRAAALPGEAAAVPGLYVVRLSDGSVRKVMVK